MSVPNCGKKLPNAAKYGAKIARSISEPSGYIENISDAPNHVFGRI